ncbi:hypothetical protein [Oceaniradius stylonematis]|uniref:hypothetical protein n=1 Tax=Oceaniradius stylonematis TaxID=2184161 RepID=UPI00268C3315|nr:hypothetical protein [Oceaniradius stylonematis]
MHRAVLTIFLMIFGSVAMAQAQDQDMIETFDPDVTIGYIEETIARSNCTPICGNPVCCIAMELRFAKHVGEGDVQGLEARISRIAPSMSAFLQAADDDPSLFEEVELTPIVDLEEFAEAEASLMNSAQSIGVDMECSTCCFQCGSKVCCGGCWTF